MPRCPGCFILMTRVEENNIRMCTCNNCFGNWMPYTTLLRLVRSGSKPQGAAPSVASPVYSPDTQPDTTPVSETTPPTPLVPTVPTVPPNQAWKNSRPSWWHPTPPRL